jgi:hypothetical protein
MAQVPTRGFGDELLDAVRAVEREPEGNPGPSAHWLAQYRQRWNRLQPRRDPNPQPERQVSDGELPPPPA